MTVHQPTEAESVAAILARAAGRHFGGNAVIEQLRRESGGASRQTWSFDAVVEDARHELILRRDPPTLGTPRPRAEVDRSASIARGTEFRVLRAAFQAGVRAPEVLFELSPDDGLGEGFVMRRIGGTAIARKLLRDPPYAAARKRIAGQLGEILARLHAVPLAGLPPLVRREATDQIAGQRRALDLLDRPQPVFELALSWLDRRKPAPTATPVLVHGDYRLDNMIFHASEPRVLGIIDWEISTLGDPLAELAYLCMLWRTPKDWGGLGGHDLEALGLPTERQMVSYYCSLSKRAVPDPALWDFYMAYNLFRVSCIRQGVYARALDGTASNVRAADSGKLVRPAAELGWKIVESIGGGTR